MRGVKAAKDSTSPQIHRIKGLIRFEGEIDKGIFSLYLSPFAVWIEDFEVETKIDLVQKNGIKYEKPEYEDFDVQELGFYIYGKNLNRKEIIRWFNKSMITVSLYSAIKFTTFHP